MKTGAAISGGAHLAFLAIAFFGITVTKFKADEDGVSVELDYVGVLATDLPNGKKAGETLRLTGRSHFVFRDGKIVRLTDYS